MEIINGYSASMSLGTTVFDNITPETSSYSLTSNIHFFSGTFDPVALYNYTTTASMLSAYASQYLGSVNSIPMTITYDDNTKKRVIKQTTPNALRFKDPRYINNSYILGTSFTKPTVGTKYKFKFTNSSVPDGFKLNGSDIITTSNEKLGSGYMIESDFFTLSGNMTLTNTNVMTHNGFEVIPYGDDDKPLSNNITWCAIDIGSNRIIYTDDIGVRDNPSFINLNTLTSTYGTDNILNSIKIEYRNKSQGEIL